MSKTARRFSPQYFMNRIAKSSIAPERHAQITATQLLGQRPLGRLNRQR
jgi:hypothetical protein